MKRKSVVGKRWTKKKEEKIKLEAHEKTRLGSIINLVVFGSFAVIMRKRGLVGPKPDDTEVKTWSRAFHRGEKKI
ncbi:hypothetical protein E2C01_033736 [Portunus trituberculatus]|uniref:Uncharacterized protein n=1 Tax=Portunus trituberculatus TaxID=210409 RepID=A0A5B7EZL8_PORTR|nr:hypothetical protein [Portunus trituberculatus]